jgi:hypothetical protein
MKALSIEESKQNLKLWGSAFKAVQEDPKSSDKLKRQGQHFYLTCLDAHLGLEGKPFFHHRNPATLRQSLEMIACEVEAEIKSKHLTPDYQARADFYRTVACFFEPKEVEQASLF